MRKKRPEWPVRLYPYHFKKDHHMIPRVWVPRTYDLEALIDALVADRSELSREALRSAAYQLVNKAIEQLVEGYAVSTPLGTLTPTVTGLWNFNRLSPDARAQNKASVSFSMGKELKKALENPLFRVEDRPKTGPCVTSFRDMESGKTDEVLTPGKPVIIEGKLLLMNGDSPERGLYLLNEETRETRAFIPGDRFDLPGRSRIIVTIPADLAPGRYLLAVASQCTTNPRPLKQVAWGICPKVAVVPEPSES